MRKVDTYGAVVLSCQIGNGPLLVDIDTGILHAARLLLDLHGNGGQVKDSGNHQSSNGERALQWVGV